MSKHTELASAAEGGLDRLFSDTTVSQEVTRASLEELRDKIDVMLESLE